MEDLQFVVRKLQTTYPNLATFTQRGSLVEEFLALEPFKMNKSQGIELVNKFMQELVKFEVVRSDLGFRILFQINEKLEEDQRRRSRYQCNSVSLLRIAKQNATLT